MPVSGCSKVDFYTQVSKVGNVPEGGLYPCFPWDHAAVFTVGTALQLFLGCRWKTLSMCISECIWNPTSGHNSCSLFQKGTLKQEVAEHISHRPIIFTFTPRMQPAVGLNDTNTCVPQPQRNLTYMCQQQFTYVYICCKHKHFCKSEQLANQKHSATLTYAA